MVVVVVILTVLIIMQWSLIFIANSRISALKADLREANAVSWQIMAAYARSVQNRIDVD